MKPIIHRYFKPALLWLAMLAPLLSAAQASVETITNDDIVILTKSELPPATIINKIRNSHTHFNVTVAALVSLKTQGVNADVINEMITSNAFEQDAIARQKEQAAPIEPPPPPPPVRNDIAAPAAEAAPANSPYTPASQENYPPPAAPEPLSGEQSDNDPKAMRPAGIYYYNTRDSGHVFTQIDFTVVSNSSSGGVGSAIAQHYTYGIAKSANKSSLPGANSRRQIHRTKPVFYFYFNHSNSARDCFASAVSPNEFAAVKFIEKKDKRIMVVGASNSYGTNTSDSASN